MKKRPRESGASSFYFLFLYVRKEAEEAGSLYSCLNGALLLRGEARALLPHDAAMRVQKLLQKVDVFVIDVSNIVLREYVVFRHTLERNIVRINIFLRIINVARRASPSEIVIVLFF